MNVQVFQDLEALSESACQEVLAKVVSRRPPFHLVLSGGSTPKRLYQMLASPAYDDLFDWAQVHVWWGDERFVPPSDPASNEAMARSALLNHVPIPGDNIHPMYRPGSADEAASAYETELRETLQGQSLGLVLLGLGPDGHTASLFPGDPSIHEQERLVVASEGAAGVHQRLTMTPPILNAAARVVFLVTGEDKADPLNRLVNGPYNPDLTPAQVVARNAHSVAILCDNAAASLIR